MDINSLSISIEKRNGGYQFADHAVVIISVVINSLSILSEKYMRKRENLKEKIINTKTEKEKCYFFLPLAFFDENVDERLSIFGTSADFGVV